MTDVAREDFETVREELRLFELGLPAKQNPYLALDRIEQRQRELEEALRWIASYYAEQYREGDIGYQAVLVARAALETSE